MEGGWNLVSIPLEPSDSTLPTVLDSINGNYTSVFTYDPTLVDDWYKWKTYVVNRPVSLNTIQNLDRRQGFWINVNDSVNLTVEGTIKETTIFNLQDGWNLIGYPSVVSTDADTAFDGVIGEIDVVFTYNASGSTWMRYEPNTSNTLEVLVPGYGYWVNTDLTFASTTWFFDGIQFNKITLLPDISIKEVSFSPPSPKEGDSITVTATVRNNGLVPTIANVKVDFYYYKVDTHTWMKLGTDDVGIIGSLGEKDASMSFPNVPYYNEYSGVNIKVVADDEELIDELNERDNKYFKNLHVRVPELTLTGKDINPLPGYPVIEGDAVNISANISNVGEAEAYNVKVGYWVTLPNGSNYSLSNVTIPVLLNGSSQVVYTSQNIINISSGLYELMVVVDPDDDIVEMNEHDAGKISMRVYEGPEINLSIAYTHISPHPYPPHDGLPIAGDRLNVSVTTRNEGDFPAKNVTVEFFHTPPGGSKYLLSNVSIEYIAPGGVNSTLSHETIWSLAPGEHNISVVVTDPLTAEVKRGWINVTVLDNKSDLVVLDFDFEPYYPIKTNTLTLKANVSNVGRKSATFDCKFYRYSGGSLTQIASEGGITLDPLENYSFQTYWNVDVIGSHNISIQADPDNLVSEENEDNNNMSINYVFIRDTGPDLLMDSISFNPSNPIEGQEVYMTAHVLNVGDTDTGGDFFIIFSREPDEIESGRISILAAGEDTYVTVKWDNANPIGTLNMSAIVDAYHDVLNESIEDNNYIEDPLRVRARPFTATFDSDGWEVDRKKEARSWDATEFESSGKLKIWTGSSPTEGCYWKKKYGIPYWYVCDFQDRSNIRGIVYQTFNVSGPSTSNSSLADVTANYRYGGLIDSYDTIPLGMGYWEIDIRVGIIEGPFYVYELSTPKVEKTLVKMHKGFLGNAKDAAIEEASTTYISKSLKTYLIKTGKKSLKGAKASARGVGLYLSAVFAAFDYLKGDAVVVDDYYYTFPDVELESGKQYTVYLYIDSITTSVGKGAFAYTDFYFHKPHNTDVGGKYFKNRGMWLDSVKFEFNE